MKKRERDAEMGSVGYASFICMTCTDGTIGVLSFPSLTGHAVGRGSTRSNIVQDDCATSGGPSKLGISFASEFGLLARLHWRFRRLIVGLVGVRSWSDWGEICMTTQGGLTLKLSDDTRQTGDSDVGIRERQRRAC